MPLHGNSWAVPAAPSVSPSAPNVAQCYRPLATDTAARCSQALRTRGWSSFAGQVQEIENAALVCPVRCSVRGGRAVYLLSCDQRLGRGVPLPQAEKWLEQLKKSRANKKAEQIKKLCIAPVNCSVETSTTKSDNAAPDS